VLWSRSRKEPKPLAGALMKFLPAPTQELHTFNLTFHENFIKKRMRKRINVQDFWQDSEDKCIQFFRKGLQVLAVAGSIAAAETLIKPAPQHGHILADFCSFYDNML
jgi:hypothetical protein